MQPLQLWLPTVVSSLAESAVQADMARAIRGWEGERTIWLLPDITETVRWYEGPTPYDRLRAVPAAHLERIDIYHITQAGISWGSEKAVCCPADFDPQSVLDAWLNAFVSRDGLGPYTIRAPRRWSVPRVTGDTIIYEDKPLPSEPVGVLPGARLNQNAGDFPGRFQVQWPLTGMPATVSLEAETARYYSTLERYEFPDGGKMFVYNGELKEGMVPLPVQMRWPESLQWLFPGGGDGALDANLHEQHMRYVAARSAENLQEAIETAHNLAMHYVRQGTTWRGFVDFFPDLIVRGAQFAFAEAAKHRAPHAVSLLGAWQDPAWNAWMKKPLKVTQVWGPIGLFWALLLEEIEQAGRRFPECEDCHRLNPGKKDKQYCSQDDDPNCYARRRARNKRNERERKRQRA